MGDNRTEKAIRFMEKLKCPWGKERGENLSISVWQRHVVGLLLRSYRNENNEFCDHRSLRVAGPMKIGKTTLAAALGLYLLCGDDEPNAVVLGASDTNAKARVIFNTARGMIEQDHHLAHNVRLNCNHSKMEIEYLPTGGIFAFGSVHSKHMWHKDPSAIIFDGASAMVTPMDIEKLQDCEIYERPERINLFLVPGVDLVV